MIAFGASALPPISAMYLSMYILCSSILRLCHFWATSFLDEKSVMKSQFERYAALPQQARDMLKPEVEVANNGSEKA